MNAIRNKIPKNTAKRSKNEKFLMGIAAQGKLIFREKENENKALRSIVLEGVLNFYIKSIV
ncbi:MAG: hypothetical protein RLY57_735 [Candidatus Parcubacteria bacterium]|jgi:hypothetical protein